MLFLLTRLGVSCKERVNEQTLSNCKFTSDFFSSMHYILSNHYFCYKSLFFVIKSLYFVIKSLFFFVIKSFFFVVFAVNYCKVFHEFMLQRGAFFSLLAHQLLDNRQKLHIHSK